MGKKMKFNDYLNEVSRKSTNTGDKLENFIEKMCKKSKVQGPFVFARSNRGFEDIVTFEILAPASNALDIQYKIELNPVDQEINAFVAPQCIVDVPPMIMGQKHPMKSYQGDPINFDETLDTLKGTAKSLELVYNLCKNIIGNIGQI